MTTLSVAESITGGLVMSKFVDISGVSNIFKGGIVCYSNDSKIRDLHMDKTLVEQSNGVSQYISNNMAINVSLKFRTKIGISTTGYAEQFGVIQPHAFISFSEDHAIVKTFYIYIHKGKIVIVDIQPQISKEIETGLDYVNRNDFREFISSFVIRESIAYLDHIKT
jgi:PncC family amidohydrolase